MDEEEVYTRIGIWAATIFEQNPEHSSTILHGLLVAVGTNINMSSTSSESLKENYTIAHAMLSDLEADALQMKGTLQ
jgi:hypothetical protein